MTNTAPFRRPRLAVVVCSVLAAVVGPALSTSSWAYGAVIPAASPALADVRAAIASAGSGDTVVIPAGAATWTEQLSLTKGIKLIGAGIGQTVITSGFEATGLYDALITYEPANPAANEPFRISGMTIDLNNLCVGIVVMNHSVTPVNKIRLDHVRLLDSSNRTIMIIGAVYGVIDNCLIEAVQAFPITCFGSNELSWSNFTFNFGTSENMYIEDCTFIINDGAFEGGLGGRYCARYNTFSFDNAALGVSPWFDMHGNQGNLATMGAEVYENVIDAGTHNVAITDVRGGKALVFNNRANTSANVSVNVREEFLDSLNPPATNPAGQPQHISDTYFWNNTKNGSGNVGAWISGTVDYGGSIGPVPQENRDFWNQASAFDGTSGLGAGPLSARPTTCTAGVAYWATDTKTLYKATATNTWEVYYRPYTYPHPLRSEDDSPSLTVVSPAGGEVWAVGASQNILWASTGTVGNVKIDFSTNGGSSYATIAASAANTGSYPWTVPNSPSSSCLVRISQASTGAPADVSAAAFSISTTAPTTTLTVASPNGGENWLAGSSHNILWSTTGSVGNVRIEYSTNGGAGFTAITTSAPNTGSFVWTVPNIPSTSCLVRISQASTGSPVDVGNAVFTITAQPTILVTSPNGGEIYAVGSTQSIRWSSTGSVGNVKLEYSTNGGTGYATIASSVANSGTYSWTVPNVTSSTCLVRISQASTGTPADTSNSVFTISSQPTITLTSPNGGESWIAGSSRNITWTWTGSVGRLKIEYSTNGGASFSTITSWASNTGSYAWTVPNTPSANCLVKISRASGTPTDAGNAVFSILSSAVAVLKLSRSSLSFGAAAGGPKTASQTVLINNLGPGSLNWTAEGIGSPNFLQVTPAQGAGNGIVQVGVNPAGLSQGTYLGYLRVSDPSASNSPQTVTVTLNVYDQGNTSAPFGSFETPVEGAIVRGSLPVTGWALDDIGLAGVKIYRELGGPNDLVLLGEATFVDDTRTDIPGIYPNYPQNYKAGWGLMLLTNFLPNQGNGVFRLHALASDLEGRTIDLGTKTINCDNASSHMPFGALDTPSPGTRVAGASYVNFGWALTPQPNKIPSDGSTIFVWLDGVALGHPVYGQYRSDIATLFPGYANSNGAIGYFYLDTTKYANGIHTISWSVADSGGNVDGIGSRFFEIFNTGGTQSLSALREGGAAALRTEGGPSDRFQTVWARKGFQPGSAPERLSPDDSGAFRVDIREVERVEIDLGETGGLIGYVIVGKELRPLPVGSAVDAARGLFSWIPGPGFLGVYDLVFIKQDLRGWTSRIPVTVTIRPKFGEK